MGLKLVEACSKAQATSRGGAGHAALPAGAHTARPGRRLRGSLVPGETAARSTSARVIARPTWQTAAAPVIEKSQLQKDYEALLQRCHVLDEDVQHYKYQAASSWGDYAEARKRILKLLDQIDSLHSDVRAEKHARIEAETRLADVTAALEAANAELEQLKAR